MRKHGRVLAWMLAVVLLCSQGQMPLQVFAQGAEGETQELTNGGLSVSGSDADGGPSVSGSDAAGAESGTGNTGGTVSGGDAAPDGAEDLPISGDGNALFQARASGGSVEVTRLEWLKALTKIFEMTVDADNYPDNYYSDIDAASSDYHDIMLATEFGLVDVEAGDPLRPDEAATREFAAHTLNLCLGYLPEAGAGYTFNEASEVSYPDDIQIAINKGWLELVDGSFLPELGITTAEMERMLAAARAVVDSTKVDVGADSRYQTAPGVIIVPEGTEAVLTGENEITLYDCSVEIAPGSIFVVVSGGLPVARRAVSVNTVENRMAITVAEADVEEAFTSLETQGSMDIDLKQAQAVGEDVQLSYIVGGTEEQDYEDGITYHSLREVGEQEVSAIIATKTMPSAKGRSSEIKVGDDTFQVSCKVSKPRLDWNISWDSGYVRVLADVTVSANLDPEDPVGLDFEAPFAKLPIGIIGYFKPSVEGKFSGKVSLVLQGTIEAGIQCDTRNGPRLSGNFYKDAFTIQAKAEVKVGVKAAIGVDAGAIKGELYAKAGGAGSVKRTEYTDNELPAACTHLTAYLYATLGGKVKAKFFGYKAEYKHELEIFKEKNSPVKVALHYEDGEPVEVCSRDARTGSGSTESGGRIYKYYTPFNSQYAYNGMNNGTSSSGEPVVIFEYSLDEKNQATITKYNGNVAALNIPETIDGYTVTKIAREVFRNNQRIQLVTIPDTVTEIGAGAFLECRNLSDVRLSKNLVKLGGYAFGACDSLTSIRIPKSLTETTKEYYMEYIYDYHYGVFIASDHLKTVFFEDGATEIPIGLFANNSSIESIVIPDTVTVIEENAFKNCSSLRTVTIPDSVTEIRAGAFLGCSSLAEVTLPKSLVKLGGYAFGDCDSLTSIMIPKSLMETTREWYNQYLYDYHYGVFIASDHLKTVTFEEGITKIPRGLFAHNDSIEEIVIPDTVTMIEERAFEKCSSLRRVALPDTVSEIGERAFWGCGSLQEVVLPRSLITLGRGALGDCDGLTEIMIPKSLKTTTIYPDGHDGVFRESDNLKTVTFEAGMTEIPNSLFANNSSIESIIIPDTVKAIKEEAFYNCKGLREIKLSAALAAIGNKAFMGCSHLKEMEIPDTVIDMGNYVFADCSTLANVKLPKDMQTITAGMFWNCEGLSSIELPESITAIRQLAFQGSGLSKIEIPANTETIGREAFQNCASLAEVKIGEKVSVIEWWAFQNCDSLTAVVIPDSVTALGEYCFADCELLQKIQMGYGLTKLVSYTFHQCPSLEEVVLPGRMNTVESNAFTNCIKLKKLTIPRSAKSIGNNAFSYPTKMTVYGVPGTYAEEWANSVGAAFVGQDKPATAVSLSAGTATLNKGGTLILTLSVTPADYTDEVTWKSSNTSVATVSDTGVVTAQNLGDAVIQVNVGNVRASCKVTVLQPVTAISLNKTSYSMEAVDTYTLTAVVYPASANNKAILWSSSDESIATVDANGNVMALGKGTAVITARAGDGSNVTESCRITVTNTLHICETVAMMESPHNYENQCSDVWKYTLAGARELVVTFDERTEMEEGFDYLHLYDASGKEVGRYTGKELAGQTLTVEGDTVRVKLVSDQSGNAWGFKVAGIEKKEGAAGQELEGEIRCLGQGSTPVTLQLLNSNGTVAAQTTVEGNAAYSLKNVASGTYTLRVSRQNYVPRDYIVTVGDRAVALDAELQLIGDVRKDGTVDARDKKILSNHIASPILTGYELAVGDVNGDSLIDAKDKKILCNHIAGTFSLWK